MAAFVEGSGLQRPAAVADHCQAAPAPLVDPPAVLADPPLVQLDPPATPIDCGSCSLGVLAKPIERFLSVLADLMHRWLAPVLAGESGGWIARVAAAVPALASTCQHLVWTAGVERLHM